MFSTDSDGGNDGTIISDNFFDGNDNAQGDNVNAIIRLQRFNQGPSGGTDMPTNQLIQYNHFKDAVAEGAANQGSALRMHLDYEFTTESAAETDTIVQYNLFDNVDNDPELISIKSQRNIIRHNCGLDVEESGIVMRSGQKNAIYANVQPNAGQAARTHGQETYWLYNYIRVTGGGRAAFRFNEAKERPDTPGRYQYGDASDGLFAGNVIANVDYIAEMLDFGNGTVLSDPTGNDIRDNLFYSDSLQNSNGDVDDNYRDFTGNINATEFCSDNTCGSNTVITSDHAISTCDSLPTFTCPTVSGSFPSDFHPEIAGVTFESVRPSWCN